MVALCALRRLEAGRFANSLKVAPELSDPGWKGAALRGPRAGKHYSNNRAL
jgi:hypothetical protein